MKTPRRLLVGVVILLWVPFTLQGGLSLLNAAEAAPLAAPTLGITPGSGPPGLSVTASGSGWTVSNGPYKIFWETKGGSELGSFTPGGSGSWSISITIPGGAAAGAHAIIACEGYGGEFEQCASASYTVVPPTAISTPTRTRTPTPPAGVTPFVLTSTFTPTASSASGCIDGITRVSPTNSADLGGVAAADLVMEVVITDPSATILRVHTLRSSYARPEYFTQWPDPLPGTRVDAVPSATDPNRWTLTVRDYPVRLGYNQIKVELTPTCAVRGDTYYQFRNGPEPTGTPRPDACGGLGFGPEASVLTFEGFGEETLLDMLARNYGVRFERTIELLPPEGVSPRSGYRVGASIEAMEFGSAMLPIRMAFDRPLTALGVFVGMQEAVWVTGDVTAVLDVYGYRGGAGDLGRLGADTTSFPAGPTDVIQCLRFDAEPGDLVTRAHVEFLDSSGGSIAERRLIDDLTIVFAEQDLPPDRPPVVEITSPADGATVSGTTILLRANIREDRDLETVHYQIDGGPETAIGASPSVSDPTSYFTGVNFSAALLHDGAPHSLTIYAYDSLGQLGSDTVTITVPTPVPSLDIQAVKMEIVQGIQCLDNPVCLDNGVPMLVGKPTWVRVYVRADGGPPRSPISGRLCRGRVSTCDTGPVLPINEILPNDDEEPSVSDRGDIRESLNFIVPPAWLTEGTLELTAFVNYEEEDADERLYDNNIVQARVAVMPERGITVMFMPTTSGGLTPALSEMWPVVEWLARVLPVSHITAVGRPALRGDFDLSDSSGDGCGRTWSRLMDALRAVYAWSGRGTAYLYGMVPEGVETDNVAGCGETPGRVASGIITPGRRGGATVAAQELGHNFGRRHAPGCRAGNPDRRYPRVGGRIDDFGIDLALRQVYPPSSSYDYMGYCGGQNNTWTSVYTYLSLLNRLPTAADAPSVGHLMAPFRAGGEPSLVGGGLISPDGFTLERGFYRASLAEGIEDDLPVGPYTALLLDAGGAILYSRDFDVIELSNHEPTGAGHFQIILPDHPEARELAFLHDGIEVGRVSASAHAPEIRIVEPTGGEDWGASGAHTISWQASDADDDPLRFNVQYSADGGASWSAIDSNLADATSLSLDSADLPGGGLLFRVLASDGLNTGESVTISPVTVANKPPMIHLASPANGDWIPAGEAVIFRGYATDYEDVIVAADAFRWSSSLDGDLGRGPTLWAIPLTPGDHEITLEVSDKAGETVRESVRIRIGGAETPAAEPPSTLILVLAVAGLLLLAGAGVGALIYFVRTRPAQR